MRLLAGFALGVLVWHQYSTRYISAVPMGAGGEEGEMEASRVDVPASFEPVLNAEPGTEELEDVVRGDEEERQKVRFVRVMKQPVKRR